jgi:hypothetical protein
MLAVSRRGVGLILEDGTFVTSVWPSEGLGDLAGFLDKHVVIQGLAQFRPSGALLRVDAEAIREAGAGDAAFSAWPLPELRRDYQLLAASVRPSQKPFDSIFGLILGEESEEEFASAVAELS